MTTATINKLNRLNQQFYDTIYLDFSQTRQLAWEGWQKLIPTINRLPTKINVLDIGCGNGRFLQFLQDNFPHKQISYLGIDNSKKLLDIAIHQFNDEKYFRKIDLLSKNWVTNLEKKFDLIVSFGILHHIPGKENREQFIQKCLYLTTHSGIFVFTAWQFGSQKKWKKRMIPFSQISLQSTEVEKNDYLIDWQRGENSIRYCHHANKKEIESILSLLPNHKSHFFVADGKSGQDNVYCILQNDKNPNPTSAQNS